MVEVDGVLIEQVLTNLIDNVLEYTPPKSPIEILASNGDGQMKIEIADHGPGLPAGTELRVFDKFFRIRPNESRRGIGLGLAIVRGIVQAHGGVISGAKRAAGGGGFFVL